MHASSQLCLYTHACILIQWLEEDFLGYLDEWENSVKKRPGTYTKTQRNMMLLSSQTRLGLRITCMTPIQWSHDRERITLLQEALTVNYNTVCRYLLLVYGNNNYIIIS